MIYLTPVSCQPDRICLIINNLSFISRPGLIMAAIQNKELNASARLKVKQIENGGQDINRM